MVTVVEGEILQRVFEEKFGGSARLYSAPGRVNLIGEHTDYNMGFVLPGAIDKGITVAIGPNGTKTHRVFSVDFGETAEFTADGHKLPQVWANYILGVVMEFHSRCFALPGFDAVFAGDVPVGGGMSSSAALESAFAFALNDLNRFGLERLELAQIGQSAEHKYAGVRCGIMDQFASLHGSKNHLMLLECRSLVHTLVPFQPGGHHLVLLDTRVKHSLASSEYNTRRAECEAGVKAIQVNFPEVQSLRDASQAMLDAVRSAMPDTPYARCKYVIEENLRAITAAAHLKAGNITAFGSLMYASHEGLKNLYAVSCPELDLLVDVARTCGVTGARMMGGGFGGCTINLVADSALNDFIQRAEENFSARFGHAPLVYPVTISDGAKTR